MFLYVHYYFSLIFISVYFSLSVGKISNEEYAYKKETDYGMNKHAGLDGPGLATSVNITSKRRFRCKEQSVDWDRYNPAYSMDDVSLNHFGKQQRNSTGHRTYFELYFAVQADGYVEICLSEKDQCYSDGIRWTLAVGADGTPSTELWFNRALVREIDTPDIFSSTQLKEFYVKIDDGKLQFGKEDDTPLISYSDVNLGSVNYYTFSITRGSAKIRYCLTALEVNCGKLPLLPHGFPELLNGTTHLGSVVQYSCATNYQLVGPARRTCNEDLQWSETAPTCISDCGQLSPLPHGSAELLNGTTYLGSVVQYSCANNYWLVGPARRTCTEDFKWSETAPTCKADCGKLPLLPHGLAELLNGTTYLGSVVQYSCATNYRLVGPARRTCAEDLQWSETAPTCEVDCGKPPPLVHGSTELLNGTTYLGSVVQYSCATFYRLEGPARRTCTEYFQWSETAPTCNLLPCKEESIHWGGETPIYSMDNVSLLHYGTQKRDSKGHRTHLEIHFAAQTEGTVGIELTDKEISSLNYAVYVGMNSRYENTILYHHGSKVQEIATPDILPSTQFKSYYIKIDDGKLQLGKEGGALLMSYNGTDLGLLNYYKFLTIEGPTQMRYCPVVVEADCGQLPPLPHGSAELLNGTTHLGSVVQYSCAAGYRLVGPALRTCTEDFKWSETAPTCKVDCGKPPPLVHGSTELLNGTTYLGSVVQYSCATFYRLEGPARRTCTEYFQWSETAPTCNLLPCKEESIHWGGETPIYSMDNVSLLHYGTQKRDSKGHRTHLEIHFAAQTEGTVGIELTDKEISTLNYAVYVGMNSRYENTILYHHGSKVQEIATPDVLPSTQFKSYYIKIDDGKLQLGKEGGALLMSYNGTDLGLLNYYKFLTIEGPTQMRYCPVVVEELPCKEVTVVGRDNTTVFSLDDMSHLHYGTLRRDSTGNRTYFELHFAAQTNGTVIIRLHEKENYFRGLRYILYVGGTSKQSTSMQHNGELVRNIATPGIVSSAQFSSFYIKIDDGKLLFGKEGEPPIISYPGVDFDSLHYYQFYSFGTAKLRYCPAVVEGSP